MARFIIKINGKYGEWSTIVDSPITKGMGLDEFKEYYLLEYGRSGMETLDARLVRVEKQGTSSIGHISIDDFVEVNRAGDDEKPITKQEIAERYGYKPEAPHA